MSRTKQNVGTKFRCLVYLAFLNSGTLAFLINVMAWLRSAMNKAAEVNVRSAFGEAVRSHTGYNAIRSANANKATRNMKSCKEAVERLEEASVSSQGEERAQMLRSWLVSLREIERQNSGSVDENDDKNFEEPRTSSTDKYDPPHKSDVFLYYDQDHGISPVNFRNVFLHGQALEGLTMSLILGAPSEEEISLLHELFGLCLTGGKEVHHVLIERIIDLSKVFSVYDDEVLAKRRELLQFAQDAISGLKINADILRIDSEVSEIHENLKTIEHQELTIESDGSYLDATNDATLDVIKESVSPIRLCCRLESLLIKKRLLNHGDTPDAHARKVDKLKVLSESLLSSASKTENRVLEHRQEKEEALHIRVAKTSEVSQIEKDLGAEISVLEKQRCELETELQKVNNSLAAANTRLQNAREEREQFDDANNQLLVEFKSKDDELSKAIVSYRAEADTCSAFVDFLEATWDFQSSVMEQKEKNVNDDLKIHEKYFVHIVKSLLSAYKDALDPAVANLRKHIKNLQRYEKAIDPDEEFLEDIERRKALEQIYLAAESKVSTIFDVVETVKDQFYHAIDDVSRNGVEPINELCDAIEKMKVDFESITRPPLRSEKSTHGEQLSSKGSPKKGTSPSAKHVLAVVDIKSILTQKLVTRPPNKTPYIPLGGSSENSPLNPNDGEIHTKNVVLEKENKEQESKESNMSKPSKSEEMKLLESSNVSWSLDTVKEVADPETVQDAQDKKTSQLSTCNGEKSPSNSTCESDKLLESDEEPAKSA